MVSTWTPGGVSPPALLPLLLLLVVSTVGGAATRSPQQWDSGEEAAQLLDSAVQRAVRRALAEWRQESTAVGADAALKALVELGRLQNTLDSVVGRQVALSECNTTCPVCPQQRQAEPEPACETRPSPLSPDAAPHQQPATRPCARSCLQLRDSDSPLADGVYWLGARPVYCDFSHDGGGWTLLLTAASRARWDPLAALGRNERSPSLTDNYSIMRHADGIRDLGSGARFAYRIETQAQTGRQRWGGIWLAPRAYSFVHETATQTDVQLVRRFDKWTYKDAGIKRRMPWLNTGARGSVGDPVVLSTTGLTGVWWGTLVTNEFVTTYHHSPWIQPEAIKSGTVLYWMREEML